MNIIREKIRPHSTINNVDNIKHFETPHQPPERNPNNYEHQLPKLRKIDTYEHQLPKLRKIDTYEHQLPKLRKINNYNSWMPLLMKIDKKQNYNLFGKNILIMHGVYHQQRKSQPKRKRIYI